MRLAALVVLLLLAGPAAAAPLEVDFHLPAQAEGGLHASGATWALLLVHDGAAFHVALEPGGQATNRTGLRTDAAPFATPGTPLQALPARELPDPVDGGLTFPPGAWASLYVEAADLRIDGLHGHAALGRATAGSAPDAYLGGTDDRTYRPNEHLLPEPGVWSRWQGNVTAPLPIHVAATGLRVLEWHNAAFACASRGACPPSAGTNRVGPATQVSYVEAQVPGGALEGDGVAFLLALGGPRFDLDVAGSLRLPDAAVRGECPGGPCPAPAGQTLLADGNLTLTGLAPHPSDPDRLAARLDGVRSAALDESPAPVFTPAAAVAVGALVALPILVKVLLALFARSARPPALQHPKRQALYDLVRAEPGLSFRAIQRRLGWPHGTLSNHMSRLLDVRLVVARPYRNTVRFFENHGRYDATWGEAVLLRDPNLGGLHAWLLEHPDASQGDVLAHWTQRGWKRSTVQDRLRSLAEGGLVERVRDGRRILYRAKQASAPPPPASAASPA